MKPVHAEILGSNQCEAEGFTARGVSPVLALCRKLLAAGFDPDRPLEAYRGDTVCLKVRSISAGARLTVDESRTAFARLKPFSRAEGAAPMRQNESAGAKRQVAAE